MKKLHKNGLDSLRAFSIARRDFSFPEKTRLFGRLSGSELLPENLQCLIGLHESWAWFSGFEVIDDSALLAVSTVNASIVDQDETLYLLPPEFQPEISFALLNYDTHWEERTFNEGFAASSRLIGDDGRGWTQLRPISDISELLEEETLVVSGWDHEHCALCNKHILSQMKYFFTEWEDGYSLLCEFCHDRFAESHSICDVIYPGEGTRSGESD